jgi:hypothetical protein
MKALNPIKTIANLLSVLPSRVFVVDVSKAIL